MNDVKELVVEIKEAWRNKSFRFQVAALVALGAGVVADYIIVCGLIK